MVNLGSNADTQNEKRHGIILHVYIVQVVLKFHSWSLAFNLVENCGSANRFEITITSDQEWA